MRILQTYSPVFERTESDLSKINWLRGIILLNPIVLVPWGRFPLCHTPIRPISAFRDLISFFGKLTYVLKEEDTNIIRGIPQIYNDNRNIKQQMATG